MSTNQVNTCNTQRKPHQKLNIPLTLSAVNYYHKALHLGCCSSPRSAADYIHITDGSNYSSKKLQSPMKYRSL